MAKRKRSNLTEEEQRTSQAGARILMIAGGAIAIFIAVMGVIMSAFNAVETANLIEQYGETVASSCQPVPVGSTSVDFLPETDPPRQMILLEAGAQRFHDWHGDLTVQWKAADEAAVALVGCVEEDFVEIETCTYTRQSESARSGETFTSRITREQHAVTITLINPATGRIVDALSLTGPEPIACPDDEDVVGSGRERGDELTWADFGVWAEAYILE